MPLIGIGAACQHHVRMRLLGNILWLILGGLLLAASWAVIGLVLCVTIIGIPFGIQSFKMAKLALWPFGSQIRSLQSLQITSHNIDGHRLPSGI